MTHHARPNNWATRSKATGKDSKVAALFNSQAVTTTPEQASRYLVMTDWLKTLTWPVDWMWVLKLHYGSGRIKLDPMSATLTTQKK